MPYLPPQRLLTPAPSLFEASGYMEALEDTRLGVVERLFGKKELRLTLLQDFLGQTR